MTLTEWAMGKVEGMLCRKGSLLYWTLGARLCWNEVLFGQLDEGRRRKALRQNRRIELTGCDLENPR